MAQAHASGIPSGPKKHRPPASDLGDGTRWNLELNDGTIVHQVVNGDTWEKTDEEVGSFSAGGIGTRSRSATYVVRNDGSTLYLDGPNQAKIASGDWDTVMTALVGEVSDRDVVVFSSGIYTVNNGHTFTAPVSLYSRGGRFEMADNVDKPMFTFDVPSDANGSFARRAMEIAGFDYHGNQANNTVSEFVRLKGKTSNVNIYNNYLEYFAGTAAIYSTGAAHVLRIGRNAMTSPEARACQFDGDGYSWVGWNDLGGGVDSETALGPIWIQGNSIFDSDANGILAGTRDMIQDNVVIDNWNHGIRVPPGAERVLIQDNAVMNNSTASDNQYQGVQIRGSSSSPVKDILVQDNICWNRDPTLSGSGNGVQEYGIQVDGYIEDSVIADNNVRPGAAGTGGLNTLNKNFTNVRLRDNVGHVRVGWGDKKNNRSIGTWYKNTSGGDLHVSVIIVSSANGTLAELTAHVNSTQSNLRVARNQVSNLDNTQELTVQAAVPNQHYYKIDWAGGTSNLSVDRWMELT